MDDAIQSTLSPDETLLWSGKPNPAVSQLNTIIMLAIALGASAYAYLHYGSDPLGTTALTGKTAAYAIGGIAAFMSLIGAYATSRTEFAITKNRIILKTGIAGTSFVSIDLEKIKEVTVSLGPVQNHFSSGTLSIDSGKTRTVTSRSRYRNDSFGRRTFFPGQMEVRPVIDQITDIGNPHEVHRILMEAIAKRNAELGVAKTA